MRKQDQITNQLLDMGFENIKNTAKYRVFSRPEVSRNIYVGKNGAIRYGNTVQDSISVSSKNLIPSLQQKYLNQ